MRTAALALLAAALYGGTAHAQGPQPLLGAPLHGPGVTPAPFVPMAAAQLPVAAPAPFSLRTFDPLKTEIRHLDNRWVLLADGAVLKEFAGREADAREALHVIRTLKLNQHGTVGSPPVMEYWLSDGHAPFSAEQGLRLVPLDLNTLQVDQADGQWRLRDKQRLLFTFGVKRQDAYLALDIIRHYGFTQLGHVGPFVPSMVYFLGNRSDQGRAPLLPPPQLQTPGPQVTRGTAKPPPGTAADPQPTQTPARAIVQVGFTAPQPAPELTEHRRFDYRRVEVRRDKNEWKLVCGSHVLANFGPNQLDAQLAWNTIQHYRFTEQCFLGKPVPVFSYFLIGGQAPRGLKFGIMTQPLRPEAVLVRRLGTGWAVCADEQPLVGFERLEEARELAETIQRHHFEYLCRIGTGMTFFVRAR
jgi:hypothetical protein